MVKKKPRQRDTVVDILRAVSILLMIVLHINPYFPRLSFTGWMWSWGQWVVPAFILCSIAVDRSDIQSVQDYLRYLWKRGVRLLVPYYLWLITYFSLMIVVGHKTITPDMIVKNLTFTGGSDFNWLVLLFIYITLALPFLRKLVDREESASLVMLLISMTTSALYLGNRSYWNSGYRWWMILPWYGITVGILLFLKWWRR
jgi:fucose 4-O-acetylase-like acetyltransferase